MKPPDRRGSPSPSGKAVVAGAERRPREQDRDGAETGSEAGNEPRALGDPRAVARKKVLLAILARREAERLALGPTNEAVQTMMDDWRQCFGFARVSELSDFLNAHQVSIESFVEVMRDLTAIQLLEGALGGDIEARLHAHQVIQSARERRRP